MTLTKEKRKEYRDRYVSKDPERAKRLAREAHLRYKHRHPERYKELSQAAHKRYQQNNADKIRERNREYAKGQGKETRRAWIQIPANLERARELRRIDKKKHPERYKEYKKKSYWKKRITELETRPPLILDCQLCGAVFEITKGNRSGQAKRKYCDDCTKEKRPKKRYYYKKPTTRKTNTKDVYCTVCLFPFMVNKYDSHSKICPNCIEEGTAGDIEVSYDVNIKRSKCGLIL